MEELKSCPFCGSDLLVSNHVCQVNPMTLFDVYCANCGCGTMGFANKSEAINIWNTRANESGNYD